MIWACWLMPSWHSSSMSDSVSSPAAVLSQLWRLREVRKYANQQVLKQLIHAFIIRRLDYFNFIFAGLAKCFILHLQRVQNATAKVIFGLRPREHVTPALLQLHWLPVYYRIQYKLCLLMYSAIYQSCPAYTSATWFSCLHFYSPSWSSVFHVHAQRTSYQASERSQFQDLWHGMQYRLTSATLLKQNNSNSC